MPITPDVSEPPHLAGVTHHWANVDGLRMHWAEAGDPAAPTIVLVHGWPQHWFAWRHQIPDLARDFHVIAPDLRGHGWTDAPATGYEKAQLARDVLGLLDHLDVEEFDLVGHDWGGWTGFLLCLDAPDRVRSYVSLNIPTPFQKVRPSSLATLWRFWYQPIVAAPVLGPAAIRNKKLMWFLLRHWATVAPPTPADEEANANFAEVLAQPDRARASSLVYRTFLTRELPALLRGRHLDQRLVTRTLILLGTGDPTMSPATFTGHEDHVDDLTIEFVEDCGHFIAEERPELVTARIRAHIGTP